MKVEPTQQPAGPPVGKPLIVNPVKALIDVPVYYATERGPVLWQHSFVCGKAFADTVLKVLSEMLKIEKFAMVHLGVYNPRQARHKDGTLIQPVRWSNHAYGEAVDFKGIITNLGEGDFFDIKTMKSKMPDKLKKLTDACNKAILDIKRKPEIVDEGDWSHIGIYPPK